MSGMSGSADHLLQGRKVPAQMLDLRANSVLLSRQSSLRGKFGYADRRALTCMNTDGRPEAKVFREWQCGRRATSSS